MFFQCLFKVINNFYRNFIFNQQTGIMKFKIKVTRTDEYVIEIDETIWDEKALKEWSKTFHPIESVKKFAENYAVNFLRYGANRFLEGYGYVRQLYSNGEFKGMSVNSDGKYRLLPPAEFTKGITIMPLSEDEEFETETKTITS